MLIRLWTLLSLGVSGFVGYQAFARAPGALNWFITALLGGEPLGAGAAPVYVSATFAFVLAASTAFVLTFLLIALGDWLKTRHALSGLASVRERQRNGDEPDRRTFLAAFGDADELVRLAADYGVTLQTLEGGGASREAPPARLRASVAASSFFRRESLVDARLFAWFFRRLPAALCGIGVLGLAFGLLEGLHALRAGAPAPGGEAVAFEPLITGAQNGLIALFLALSFAVAIGLLQHVALALRYQQTAELCRLVDSLFRREAATEPAAAGGGVRRPDDVERAVASAITELSEELDAHRTQLAETYARQGEATASAVSKAVRSALAEPMDVLGKALAERTRDEREQVGALVSAALNAFVGELERNFGNQLAEVNELLASSSATAAEIRNAFAEIAESVPRQAVSQAETFGRELHAALKAANEQHVKDNKQLANQLKRLAAELSRAVDKQAQSLEGSMDRIVERVERVAETSLSATGKDLAKTAAAFNGLQSVVESLSLSVTPILNQVVDTQERLLGTLEDEAAGGRQIATAAGDLNAAARASRETVEKFVALARALSEASRALAAVPEEAETVEEGERPAGARRHAAASRLGQALSDLREETEDASKELPEL